MAPSAPILPTVVGACATVLLLRYYWHRRRRSPAVPPAPKELVDSAICQPCEDSGADEPSAAAAAAAIDAAAPPPSSPGSLLPPTSGAADDRTPRKALLGGSPFEIGLSKDNTATSRRDNAIGWHDYFMSVAMLSAFRSKDPNRQVGACIVDPKTQRIVGIGYNGFPWGCCDDQLPWARSAKGGSWLDSKYPYVCHAEMNAIFNKNCSSLDGCRIYTTLFPCNECAKLIIQARMLDVVYFSDAHAETDSMRASRRMLEMANVQTWRHKPSAPRVVIDFTSELAQ